MKAGLIPLVLVTGVLIAAGVLVAFTIGADDSGGGDTSSLEGYFQALNTAQTDIRAEYAAVETQFPEAFSDKQQTVDYLDTSAEAWASGATTLEGIDAPAETADAHGTLVVATGDVSQAFTDLGVGVQDIEDEEAALQEFVNSADTTAFDAYAEACTALQVIADDNAVTDDTGAAIVLVC